MKRLLIALALLAAFAAPAQAVAPSSTVGDGQGGGTMLCWAGGYYFNAGDLFYGNYPLSTPPNHYQYNGTLQVYWPGTAVWDWITYPVYIQCNVDYALSPPRAVWTH